MNRIKYIISKLMLKIQIPAVIKSKIHSTARICSKSHVFKSTIEAYSYVGNDCKVFHCSIGKFCSIADGCFLGGAQHSIEYVSTSPVFHKGKNVLRVNFAYHDAPPAKRIDIGNDVWIGASVLVKGGVKIGNGAVVAMGSVVTKDVEPYTIVAGIPAKLVRHRFTKNEIDLLEKIQWWNWEKEKLQGHAQYFADVNLFLSKVGDEMTEGECI